MRKSIVAILLLQATCAWALTPSATPGENLWPLVARIGQELDVSVELENSFLPVIESKVDDLAVDAKNAASCCESLADVVAPINSLVEVVTSTVDAAVSQIDSIHNVDLTRIESKIDNVASAANQSVNDDFFTTWSLIDNVASTVSVIESIVEDADSIVDTAISGAHTIHQSDVPVIEFELEVVNSDLDELLSCYDRMRSIVLFPLNSLVDDLFADTTVMAEVGATINSSFLPIIESKIDALDHDVSVVDHTTSTIDSTLEVLASKIDALTVGGGSPCSATAITQAAIDAALGIYTISAAGAYCLAEEAVGDIVIDASDVTLDLNNHTLTGTISFLNSTHSRIEIRNGRLKQSSVVGNYTTMRLFGTNILVEDLQFFNESTSGAFAALQMSAPTEPARQVVIRRCTFSNSNQIAGGIFIRGGASNVQIVDSTFIGFSAQIFMSGATPGGISSVEINNCYFAGPNGDAGVWADGDGVIGLQIINSTFLRVNFPVYVEATLTNGIERVLVKGCRFANSPVVDLYVVNIKNVAVLDTVVAGGVGDGMTIINCNNVNVAHCSVRDKTGTGILVAGSNTGAIEYNTIVGNALNGIQLTSDSINLSVEHNDLVNNVLRNLDFSTTVGEGADVNIIVANKAHTTGTDTGTGSNYSSQTTIPVIQWDRSARAITWVNTTPATMWHNWSSVA